MRGVIWIEFLEEKDKPKLLQDEDKLLRAELMKLLERKDKLVEDLTNRLKEQDKLMKGDMRGWAL